MRQSAAKMSFTRLIKLYTAIISVMVVFATGIFAWSTIRGYESEIRQADEAATATISRIITSNQRTVNQFANTVLETPNNIESLNRYFSDSVAAYANYAIDESLRSGRYFYWPTESRQFFIAHPEVAMLTLQLNNSKQAFVATAAAPSGHIESRRRNQAGAILAPLINQFTLKTDGVLGVQFKTTDLNRQLRQTRRSGTLQIFVQNDQGGTVYQYAGHSVDADEHAMVKKQLARNRGQHLSDYEITRRNVADGYTLILLRKKSATTVQLLSKVMQTALIGVVVLIVLTNGLWLLFRRYQQQLSAIVDTVKQVSAGNLDARVPVNSQHTDLQVLAEGINAMLEALHEHVYTIYQLRIAQQEATMKALQAQINPHFMSNTLEYIRMAALDADQPELAEVVYSFAALLRNNVDMSPVTTLKQELNFIEKYVFLYQVRFPDRLAYQIQVTPDVANIQLPKFSLQPIVENYFVHGVDFRRQDNALSVKAWREGQTVHIAVVNNGKSLDAVAVAEINQRMREPLGNEQKQSIGIQNVYSRMHEYFGDSLEMAVGSDGKSGVIVTMRFQMKGGDDHEDRNARG